jgi:hypothetical protein
MITTYIKLRGLKEADTYPSAAQMVDNMLIADWS